MGVANCWQLRSRCCCWRGQKQTRPALLDRFRFPTEQQHIISNGVSSNGEQAEKTETDADMGKQEGSEQLPGTLQRNSHLCCGVVIILCRRWRHGMRRSEWVRYMGAGRVDAIVARYSAATNLLRADEHAGFA